MKSFLNATLIGCSLLTLVSCDKNDTKTEEIQPYTVPTTYSFDNVEYAEASSRVSMWSAFTAYLGRGTSRQLSQDTVNYLWNNSNNAFTADITTNLPYTAATLNSSGFNLSAKTTDPTVIKAFADSQVKVSQYYNVAASPGNPGKVGTRLVNYSGLEFNQAVAKGLFGALQLSQVFTYLDKTKTDDNSTVTAGKGTAMQHDWDLAFGYVGIPTDYDSSKAYANTEVSRPLAVGGYFRERGQYIQSGGIVYQAFRRGRAAIGAKDYKVRDEAISTIKATLEKTLAASAYAYLTLPQGSSDLATKFHAMSEGYGFVQALKYRPSTSPLTEANYQTLLSIMKTNFYDLAADASNAKLKQGQSILTAAYGQLQPQ